MFGCTLRRLADRAGHYQGEKFSTHSLMKHYGVVRTWFRWMYAQKIIENRVTDFVKPPRLSSRLPSILTDEEIDMLFEDLRTQNFRNLVIFELFLDTGMRLEEVASLSVDDVNIEGGWIRVIGKGDVEDIVPIGAKVSRDLFAYMEMHRKPAHESERSLFLSDHGPTTGYGLTYEAMSKLVTRELRKVRQTGKRGAHVMRHTAGTNMIRGGASTEHVRRILRHRDGSDHPDLFHLANEDLLQAHRAASPIDRRQTKSQRRGR